MSTSMVSRELMHHRALPRTYPDAATSRHGSRPPGALPAAAAASAAATTGEAASAEGAAATKAGTTRTRGGCHRRGSRCQAACQEGGVEGVHLIVADVPVRCHIRQPSHRHQITTDLGPAIGQLEDDRPRQVLGEDVFALFKPELISFSRSEVGLEALDLVTDRSAFGGPLSSPELCTDHRKRNHDRQ